MIMIVMGVSGSGKTTIGSLLAKQLDGIFADADDYHSAANKQKMAAGHPLNDDDREPWLETLNDLLKGWLNDRITGVLACSALKEKYRSTLVAGLPADAVRFILLELSHEEIAARMAKRSHEYMNPSLLDSQFAALEIPEYAVRIRNDRPASQVVDQIVAQIK